LVNWEKRTQNEPKRTQNEPKSKEAKMNVNEVLTKDYENISNWAICENEPNTNPNKPNFRANICRYVLRLTPGMEEI